MNQQLKLIILACSISLLSFVPMSYAFFQDQVNNALQSAYAKAQQWFTDNVSNASDAAKNQLKKAACSGLSNVPIESLSKTPDVAKKKLCEVCSDYLKENNKTDQLKAICEEDVLETSMKKNEPVDNQPVSSLSKPLLKVGETGYVDISSITPGQLRYSSLNVKDKVNKALANKNAEKIGENKYKLLYNDGTSILNSNVAKDTLPVIISPHGLVLVDGHHDLLSSFALGAKTIPVKVIDDLSNTGENFWKVAYDKGYVYPFNLKREFKAPVSFTKMQNPLAAFEDDTNRYFAAITARKCLYKPDSKGNPYTVDQQGPEYPLWLKRDKDIPFLEFMISDVLNEKGFHAYKNEMGNTISQPIIEEARKILAEAIKEGTLEKYTVNVQPDQNNLADKKQLYIKISCMELVPEGVKGSTLNCPVIPAECK